MKKIYITPCVKITQLQVTRMLLENSLGIHSDETVDSGWAKEENDWWDE